jgi:putative phosphoribosyl transferase
MARQSKVANMNAIPIDENEFNQVIHIPADGVELEGSLAIPKEACGVVLFAHGSGSSRHSPRNNFVAQTLQNIGIGTLLMDLLTQQEDMTYETRFDIDLLTSRLERATEWLMEQPQRRALDIGYFGASTGAAAALKAAATLGTSIGAVVSRGGRPDLAMSALSQVQSPTLLIVGGLDDVVIELNRQAYQKLKVEKHMTVIPGATHLFEEPGALQEVAGLAARWFTQHLGGKKPA